MIIAALLKLEVGCEEVGSINLKPSNLPQHLLRVPCLFSFTIDGNVCDMLAEVLKVNK
jgi:hypothetical protein